MRKFDAIVIGAGQAGVPLSKKLASSGLKTALVEKEKVGGVCVNEGCTPTKTMIASARMAYLASRSEDLGIIIKNYDVDFERIVRRKDAIAKAFREGAERGIDKVNNLSLIYGEASFIDEFTVKVSAGSKDLKLTAPQIFINVGNTPIIPEIDGLHDTEYFTSKTILDLDEVPEHLAIIGGGYIGLEYAQMFRRFGAKVTILERGKTLMPYEDEDVCMAMSEIFEEDGIDVIVDSKVSYCKQNKSTKTVAYETKGEKRELRCSHILISAGRRPNIENLNLKAAGIRTQKSGTIPVNKYLQTNKKHIYALGDVNGNAAFTHIAYNDYVIVSKNLLEGKKLNTMNRVIPYCLFTDPQLGRVGITEKQAKQKGLDYKVAKIPMKNVARAIETAETRGFMKAIIHTKTKKILGAAILGEEGGEIMSVLQMAMLGNITYEQIRYNIFAHPLYSESLMNLFMRVDK